jgi:hypothetical protein
MLHNLYNRTFALETLVADTQHIFKSYPPLDPISPILSRYDWLAAHAPAQYPQLWQQSTSTTIHVPASGPDFLQFIRHQKQYRHALEPAILSAFDNVVSIVPRLVELEATFLQLKHTIPASTVRVLLQPVAVLLRQLREAAVLLPGAVKHDPQESHPDSHSGSATFYHVSVPLNDQSLFMAVGLGNVASHERKTRASQSIEAIASSILLLSLKCVEQVGADFCALTEKHMEKTGAKFSSDQLVDALGDRLKTPIHIHDEKSHTVQVVGKQFRRPAIHLAFLADGHYKLLLPHSHEVRKSNQAKGSSLVSHTQETASSSSSSSSSPSKLTQVPSAVPSSSPSSSPPRSSSDGSHTSSEHRFIPLSPYKGSMSPLVKQLRSATIQTGAESSYQSSSSAAGASSASGTHTASTTSNTPSDRVYPFSPLRSAESKRSVQFKSSPMLLPATAATAAATAATVSSSPHPRQAHVVHPDPNGKLKVAVSPSSSRNDILGALAAQRSPSRQSLFASSPKVSSVAIAPQRTSSQPILSHGQTVSPAIPEKVRAASDDIVVKPVKRTLDPSNPFDMEFPPVVLDDNVSSSSPPAAGNKARDKNGATSPDQKALSSAASESPHQTGRGRSTSRRPMLDRLRAESPSRSVRPVLLKERSRYEERHSDEEPELQSDYDSPAPSPIAASTAHLEDGRSTPQIITIDRIQQVRQDEAKTRQTDFDMPDQLFDLLPADIPIVPPAANTPPPRTWTDSAQAIYVGTRDDMNTDDQLTVHVTFDTHRIGAFIIRSLDPLELLMDAVAKRMPYVTRSDLLTFVLDRICRVLNRLDTARAAKVKHNDTITVKKKRY